MKCPRCESDQCRKNGRPNGHQRYLCKACRKQFLEPRAQSFICKCTETRLSEGIQQKIAPATTTESGGIAILLLDAENLKLKVNAEQFLASLCGYPLQVKIAFANWKNLGTGKLDAELYDRGYELIHVPGGANSADAKMIAFGAAILYRYRDVKEVFVCSSDGLLNHLCNQLQNQGLTVFRVRHQNAVLSVENRLTGDTNHYSCEREEEIPSFEELANQHLNGIESLDVLKNILLEIIESAKIELKEDAIPVTKIKKYFWAKYHSHADLIVKLFLGYNSSLIKFLQSESAIFKIKLVGCEYQVAIAQKQSASKNDLSAALEASLEKIVLGLTAQSPGSYIPINQVAGEFHKQYGQPITKKMRSLDLGSNFHDFLHKCKTFKVQKKDKDYQVAIAHS